MINVKENLYFDPERLLLVTGTIENLGKVESDIKNNIENLFKEASAPADVLFPDQVYQTVDYNTLFPINGGICLSDACQLRCNYCAFASDNSHEKKTVNLEDAEVFVDYLIGNCIIRRFHNAKKDYVLDLYFAGGGEPTFDWNLLFRVTEMVKMKCHEQKISYKLGITTNGLLDERQIQYIAENFDIIAISFDGLPEIQNQNRKLMGERDSFNYVDKTIRELDELGKNIILRTTIWPKDYDKLLQMLCFVCSNYKNIDTWDVEPVNARGRAIEQKDGTINKSFVSYYVKAQKYIREQNFNNILMCGKFKDNITGYSCGTSFGQNPWLLPDGRLVTCLDAREVAPTVAKIEKGVINKYKFEDRLTFLYMEKREKCKNCFAYKFCGGGCPIKYTNIVELDTMKCECEMIREYWIYIFEKLIDSKDIFDWTTRRYHLNNHPEVHLYQIWRKTWKLQ